MSTFRISTKLMNSVNAKLWSGTSDAPTFVSDGGGNNNNYYTIMKGAVPTDWTGLGNWQNRGGDVLVRWGKTGPSNIWRLVDPAIPQTTIQAPYAIASGTGLATWMWITASTFTTVGIGNILTVSAPGGGGEIIISNASVEAGRQYKLNDVIFSVPTDYTF